MAPSDQGPDGDVPETKTQDGWIIDGLELIDGNTESDELRELQPAWDVPDTVAVTADLTHFCDPDELIEEGIACLEAGASALHVHMPDGDGGFTADPATWERIVSEFRAVDPDVVVDAGPHGDTFEERATLLREGYTDVVGILPSFDPEYGQQLLDVFDEAGIVPSFRTTGGSITRTKAHYRDRIQRSDPVLWVVGTGNPFWHRPNPDPFAMASGLIQRIRAIRSVDPDGRICVIGGGRESTFMTTQALLFGCDVRGGVAETSFRYPHSDEPLEHSHQMVADMVAAANSIGRRPLTPTEYRAELDLS